MDHDQRFKALLREFFADFMALFFPEWAACFDLTAPEWLDQELLPDPPDGDRHLLDLAAKVRTTRPLADGLGNTPAEWLALVHVEVEAADRTTALKPRLPGYYVHLRERHGLPVLPVVLYLRVGMGGVGVDEVTERVGEFPVLTFRYLYVGLPALDAVQYVRGENLLGVSFAALMSAPEAEWPEICRTAARRLAEAAIGEFRKYLLAECFQAYAPLDEQGRQEFGRAVMAERKSVLKPRNKTFWDEGLEQAEQKGREEGREEGAAAGLRDVATALLESRFQTLPADVTARLAAMTAPQLHELVLRVHAAASLAELFPAETPGA